MTKSCQNFCLEAALALFPFALIHCFIYFGGVALFTESAFTGRSCSIARQLLPSSKTSRCRQLRWVFGRSICSCSAATLVHTFTVQRSLESKNTLLLTPLSVVIIQNYPYRITWRSRCAPTYWFIHRYCTVVETGIDNVYFVCGHLYLQDTCSNNVCVECAGFVQRKLWHVFVAQHTSCPRLHRRFLHVRHFANTNAAVIKERPTANVLLTANVFH